MLVLSKRNQLLDIAVLVIIYVVSILIVNPLGDFPLNDDWSYARAVKGLVEYGDWRPTGWTGASLITQSFWGAIFCVPGGFSFNALRYSTLILAILGVIGVYVLFVTNDRGRILAVIAALTLAFNPIYYELSFTFMTDIPFSALAILSSIFFVRCVPRFGYLDLLIACVLAVAATLCRQLGLFLPLAFAVASGMQRGFATKWLPRAILRCMVPAILPSIVCVAALMLFQRWMRVTGRTPALYGTSAAAGGLSIRTIGSRADTALLYLGLFCLPILLLGSSNQRLNTNSAILRVLPALLGGVFALLSIYFIFGLLERWMPISGNILIPQGLGAISIAGHLEKLPSLFWGIVTVLTVIGGTLLVREMVTSSVVLIQKIRIFDMKDEDVIQIFFLTAVGAYALPILVNGFYDRYLVPLVPFLLYLNARELPCEDVGARIRKSAAAVLVTFTAAFAVLGTRDFLAWNRVRWEALTELRQTAGVSDHDIDGGFEYIGWFLYDTISPSEIFSIKNAKYRIGFSKVAGFTVVKQYEYVNWMPPKPRTIFVLKRDMGNSMLPEFQSK